MDPQKKKILLGIGIFGAVVFILFTIFSSSRNNGKLLINLVALPEDSTVTIDGQPSKTGRVYLVKGEHTLKATRQYFDAVSKTINTKDIKRGDFVYLVPGASSQEAIQWLLEHPDTQNKREAAGGREYAVKTKQITEKYPIVSKLPYPGLDFRIDYAFDAKDNLSLIVTLKPVATVPGTAEYKQQLIDFRKEALTFIESNGVDTKKTAISFSPDPDKL